MSINHHELAVGFLAGRVLGGGTRSVHCYQGDFWEWNGKVYQLLPKSRLKQQLLRWLQSSNGLTDPRVSDDVFTWVDAILTTESLPRMPMWLPGSDSDTPYTPEEIGHEWLLLSNGILDVTMLASNQVVLRPMSPRWFSSVLIPHPYRVDAECPQWCRAMGDWMSGDGELVSFLQEFVGYCLVPDTSHDLALFLEGEGSNGKTTFSSLVEALVGRENCSAVPLEHWTKAFELASTLGKLVNFATETDGNRPLPSNRLKSFISGDTFTFPIKYKPIGITAQPTARLIISWNRRPRVTDESDGFWRRVQLVPWRRQFSREDRDENLENKLKAELPGILRWAVAGLCRLRSQGKFTQPEAVTSVTECYRLEADPIRAFVKEFLERRDEGLIPKDDVYECFREWCYDLDVKPADRAVFCKGVLHQLPGVSVVRVRTPTSRMQSFTGIGWTHAGLRLLAEKGPTEDVNV